MMWHAIRARVPALSRRTRSFSEQSDVFDRVLVAVGRRPNGDRIDAAAAGLEAKTPNNGWRWPWANKATDRHGGR